MLPRFNFQCASALLLSCTRGTVRPNTACLRCYKTNLRRSLKEHVRAQRILPTAPHRRAFVPELVVEEQCRPGSGDHGYFGLIRLPEACFAALRSLIQVDEEG